MNPAFLLRGSIRNKIFAVSLLPILALLVLAVNNYRSLNALGESAERILSRNYESIRGAVRVRRLLEENRNMVVSFMLRRQQGPLNIVQDESLRQGIDVLQRHIAESGEKQIVEELSADLDRYAELLRTMSGGPTVLSVEKFVGLTTRMVAGIDSLIDLNERGMERAGRETRALAERAQHQSLALLLSAIALILLLCYGLSTRIARPIRKLAQCLADSRKGGDPYPVLPVQSEDEIGLLIDQFNRLFQSLAEYDRHNADTLAVEKAKVRQAEEAKARFVADLSHQLKTPMTSLAMSVNLLWEKREGLSEERKLILLDTARDDCRRLALLINELMDIVRLEAMSRPAVHERIEVATLVHECLRPLRKQAEEKAVRLVLDLQPDLPPLSLDSLRFPWVLTNLVGNALRYTAGGGQITIRIEQRSSLIYFMCSDTGSGISPEHLPRIFERYSQFPGGDRGTAGLGLAIVKDIIERHGGGITVTSTPGLGTTFTFWIPQQAEAAHAKSTPDR